MARGAVGFVGLDEVSLNLAASLLQSGYAVQAFEASSQLLDDFSKQGGKRCTNLMESGQGVNALVILISHVDQINDLFFADEVFLREDYQIEIVVDMHASKAVSEALNGKVMITLKLYVLFIGHTAEFNFCSVAAMGEKLFLFEGDIGAGSKSKMVIELLEEIHFVASLEAMCLGAQAGIHPRIIYDIISNAAGNSWVFKNYVPHLLRGNQSTHHLLSAFNQNLGIVLEMAKSLIFPLPLLTVAHQQILAGYSHGVKDGEDTALLKVWEKLSGVNIIDAANAKAYNPEELASKLSTKSKTVKRIGFIGLGAMGFGMATHLLKSNFTVLGYDVSLQLPGQSSYNPCSGQKNLSG
ncbi:UNVERIFIED_CONTAM: L-threonate dehydrogenase [Sesamum calycinum]|uniref:L-threonate dehydrogenase n=1 Tax=Sesamum calycinum TaxID=2727403 RepID=A0AAW2NFV9_9LAMI